MNKNIFYRIYAAAFIGICLVPAVLTPFVKSDSSKEKRELGKLPSVKTEKGELNFEFFDEFETYFSEHFAFRPQLVTADGRLKAALTATSPNSDVIVGKDGWLYYGEAVNDFLRTDTLSSAEIKNIANNLRIIEKYCLQRGAEFIFFSAPNKNTLYPEYMPYNYVPSDRKSNLEMLTAELADDNFFFDMKSALLNLESPTPLYHKTDTHWNNFGAYAAHTMLMNKIGKAPCGTGNGWYTAHDRLGDLAAMIYPAEDAKDMQLHNDYEFTYEYTSRFRGLDDIFITTSCGNGDGELLMYRDSYGEAILPYMAEVFESAEFSRAVPYRLSSVKKNDTVIIELVERNLRNLLNEAPIMEAPLTDVPDKAERSDGRGAVLESYGTSGMMHIFGVLPEDCFSGDSHRIVVQLENEAFEAFNCFEPELLDEEEYSSRGFSLYIPEDKKSSTYKVTVLNSDGRAVSVQFTSIGGFVNYETF
ncbi:MAG: hypothetical protein J6B75_11075 [Ruminococcus sp.]|nr:hypothetical protein [Ruminococcus sp.]MBO5164958.1 hypothetical protein [Ruminococcus sp.]